MECQFCFAPILPIIYLHLVYKSWGYFQLIFTRLNFFFELIYGHMPHFACMFNYITLFLKIPLNDTILKFEWADSILH